MPAELWRDEFQEYAVLLDAIASGDRSRAAKLLGAYILGAKSKEATNEVHEVNSSDSGDSGDSEERGHAYSNQTESTADDTHDGDGEQHEETLARTPKRVRFADEEEVAPADEYHEDGYGYGYDGDQTAYHEGAYDESAYDGNAYDENAYDEHAYGEHGYGEHGYDENAYGEDGYGDHEYEYDDQGYGEDVYDEHGNLHEAKGEYYGDDAEHQADHYGGYDDGEAYMSGALPQETDNGDYDYEDYDAEYPHGAHVADGEEHNDQGAYGEHDEDQHVDPSENHQFYGADETYHHEPDLDDAGHETDPALVGHGVQGTGDHVDGEATGPPVPFHDDIGLAGHEDGAVSNRALTPDAAQQIGGNWDADHQQPHHENPSVDHLAGHANEPIDFPGWPRSEPDSAWLGLGDGSAEDWEQFDHEGNYNWSTGDFWTDEQETESSSSEGTRPFAHDLPRDLWESAENPGAHWNPYPTLSPSAFDEHGYPIQEEVDPEFNVFESGQRFYGRYSSSTADPRDRKNADKAGRNRGGFNPRDVVDRLRERFS